MLPIFLLILLFTCYIILLSYYMFMLEYHHDTRITALQLYSTFVKASSLNDAMLYAHSDVSTVVVWDVVCVCVLAVGGGMTGACFGVWCGVVSRCVIVCGVLRWLIGMRMSGSCLMVYAGAVTSAFVRGTDALLQT